MNLIDKLTTYSPGEEYKVEGLKSLEITPLPKSHNTEDESILLLELFVKFTKSGGLEQTEKLISASPAAITSNTDNTMVVSSTQPILSVTSKYMPCVPSVLKFINGGLPVGLNTAGEPF